MDGIQNWSMMMKIWSSLELYSLPFEPTAYLGRQKNIFKVWSNISRLWWLREIWINDKRADNGGKSLAWGREVTAVSCFLLLGLDSHSYSAHCAVHRVHAMYCRVVKKWWSSSVYSAVQESVKVICNCMHVVLHNSTERQMLCCRLCCREVLWNVQCALHYSAQFKK